METQFKEEAEEKKNVPQTPAATTTGKRGTTVASACPETRRLLEKEIDAIESVQYDASDNEKPKDLEGIMNENSVDIGKASEIGELNEQKVSDDIIMKIGALEAHWDTKSDVLRLSDAHARELKGNIQECIEDNREDLNVKREQSSQVFDESVIVSEEMLKMKKNKDADDEVHDDDKDDHVDLHTISGVACESDIPPFRNLETSLGLIEEVPEVPKNGKGADKDLGSKDSAVVMEPAIAPHSSVPQEINQSFSVELVVNDLVSEDSAETDFDAATWSVTAAAEEHKQHTGLQKQNLASPEEGDRIFMKNHNDMRSNLELSDVQDFEELFDYKPPSEDAVVYEVQDLDSSLMSDDKPKGEVSSDDGEIDMDLPEHSITSCIVISENDMVDQFADQESMDFGNLLASANQITPKGPSSAKTPCPVISSVGIPMGMVADPLSGQISSSLRQMASNSDHVTCPANATLTPVKKSSSKTPNTSRKISNPSDDKENIGNSGKKLVLTKEKGKKDKKENMAISTNTSLRQLKKMVKKKEDIIKEKNDTAKVGRERQVLQALSENRMTATAELDNEN